MSCCRQLAWRASTASSISVRQPFRVVDGVLTETGDTQPFSAYSYSKALGEQVIDQLSRDGSEAVIIRATSVQGAGRATTASLQRIARSRFSSVAGAGDQPSAVSSLEMLCEFVRTRR